jgi:plasmid stabilization system protein ParE
VTHVELSPGAERDLARLEDFLSLKSQKAADAAVVAITHAILSLREFPERAPATRGRGRRELLVKYGRDGYIIRYRVTATVVLVTRIFHGRERR